MAAAWDRARGGIIEFGHGHVAVAFAIQLIDVPDDEYLAVGQQRCCMGLVDLVAGDGVEGAGARIVERGRGAYPSANKQHKAIRQKRRSVMGPHGCHFTGRRPLSRCRIVHVGRIDKTLRWKYPRLMACTRRSSPGTDTTPPTTRTLPSGSSVAVVR